MSKNTNKTINSVIKTNQPYEAAMWDGLELLTIDTTDSVYNFPNIALSYSIRTNGTSVQICQLINHKMVTLGSIEVETGSDINQAVASFLLACQDADSVHVSKNNIVIPEKVEYVSIRPQCDEYGWQSEDLAIVDILADDTCYSFPNMRILESRAYHPFWSYTFAQVDGDEVTYAGMIEIDVRGMDEDDINERIAEHLLLHGELECDAC